MPNLHILLTRSNTCISRIIHMVTSEPYTHAAIAFDDNLQTFYSFSRKFRHFPFPAGLQRERLHRMLSAPCAVYSLQVDLEIWERAKMKVVSMMDMSECYRYNLTGLPLCFFGIKRSRNAYYFCSEFVGEVLQESGAVNLPKDPSLMHPSDYMNLPRIRCIYRGDVAGLLWQFELNKYRGTVKRSEQAALQ